MKAKLQLLAMLFISALGFSQITTGISPATATQGATITAGFNYTAAAAGTCQIQLFKTTAAGAIDYSAGTSIYFVGPVPAAATTTPFTTTFTVPADLAPTNTLPAGVVYKWFFKLTVSGADSYGPNPVMDVVASGGGTVNNAILSNSAPANAEQGSTITASFNYTANAAGTCQMQLYKTDATGAIDYTNGATALSFTGPIAAASTSTLKSQTFSVPADFPLSSSLPAGVVYKWFFKMEVPAGTPFYTTNPTTNIVAAGTLSTKSFNVNGVKVIYNAKTKSLVFYDVDKSEMSIYDVKGSSVMRLNTVSQNSSFDLSSLTNGLYFLKSNNGRTFKFLVQ